MVTAALLLLASRESLGGVSPSLASHLKTGVNVTRWFCYLGNNEDAAHFRNYLVPEDYREFGKLNLGFIRLCISPDVIYSSGSAKASVFSSLDAAVEKLNRAGMAVLWDLHDNGQLHLDQPSGSREGFIKFWRSVAEHYRGKAETNLVFELLNEPVFQKNPQDWYSLQAEAVRAIRVVDPRRPIMVTSTSWSNIDTFATMQPLPERNLIYTFHCYDPFFFTHQGAEWVGEYPGKFKKVPFPASPDAVSTILLENDSKYRGALEEYGRAHYDDQYLKARIAKAAEWGTKNHVLVVLGEFGAYPKVSPPDSRARWFDGMRKAIDSAEVGSAIWGYDDGLGLGRSVDQSGTVTLDHLTLKHFYKTQG